MTHSQLYVRKTDFIKVKNCLNDNQLLHSDVILTVSTPSVDQPESQPVLMVNTSTVSTPSVDQPESQPVLMV
ncbi:MAG: hypothetical protein SAK29_15785, partial [Scytonema sp. PMC 1069.18]|nr:hypothetical protein [Scytonema sp. PMC 1069.18]MEC4886770.1 hypothetical protein [Scytonema sp. PMC 1070.18]